MFAFLTIFYNIAKMFIKVRARAKDCKLYTYNVYNYH